MENAKHIGCMCALAVALGVGMAVASTPAVAIAAPADSGKGSSSGDSSPSSQSRHSGSTSSDAPSAKRALSATNDAPNRHRRPPKSRDEAATSSSSDPQDDATTGAFGSGSTTVTDALQHGGSAPAKTRPHPAAVNTSAADTTVPVPSTAAAPAVAPLPAVSTVSTPIPADPVSSLVVTLINAVLSPFAVSAPSAPVQTPADFTLLAFARREFEQTPTPSTAADPGFISSTHDFFGLFSVTSAADPDDNHFVAFVLQTPFFTNVLTSGTDPEDNLGFGTASTGVAGQTVNTFMSPFLTFSIAIPIEDPFAELFTELVRAGF